MSKLSENRCAPKYTEGGHEGASLVLCKCSADLAPVFYVKYRISHNLLVTQRFYRFDF